MKIRDILVEVDTPANPKNLDQGAVASLKGAVSMPDISNNKSNGSAYLQYRYGIALAGAHSDKDKSVHTDPAGPMAGDPLFLTFTDEEGAMMKNAADMVGAGQAIPLGSKRSEEHHEVHKTSPVNAKKKNRYGV